MRQEIKLALHSVAIFSIWMTGAAPLARAQPSGPASFSSASEATQNLFDAVDKNDEQEVQKILGGSSELTSSSAEEQDKADRQLFCEKYKEMHRLHREHDGSVTLYLGAENWPFPIPLVQKGGVWQFDSEAGKKEIRFRQIGENELTAIAICHEYGAAKTATPAAAPAEDSAAALAGKVTRESAGHPVLFFGYYYRLVPTRKGTALIAYPAEYRSSGVMTFASLGNNLVYEKDLGPKSSELAGAMAAFRKDTTWRASR